MITPISQPTGILLMAHGSPDRLDDMAAYLQHVRGGRPTPPALVDDIRERYRLIVGESAKMKQAVDLARKTAASNATVLLLGESGTGKEIFARSIHNWSARVDRPFIAINSVGLSVLHYIGIQLPKHWEPNTAIKAAYRFCYAETGLHFAL